MKGSIKSTMIEMGYDVGYGIYHVNFLHISPAAYEKGIYAQWYFTKPQLEYILGKWDDIAVWKELKHIDKPLDRRKFHPTAHHRSKPSNPIKQYLKSFPASEAKSILYHGIGKDDIGLEALSCNGKNSVYGYDPYHPDERRRALPYMLFDEIHSHYTLSAVDKEEGKQIVKEISDRLKPSGMAVISVRRDLEATKEYRSLVRRLYS